MKLHDSEYILLIKQLRSALSDAKSIILDDLGLDDFGTEIEYIEEALEKSKEFSDTGDQP
jgi:hypothetical protein